MRKIIAKGRKMSFGDNLQKKEERKCKCNKSSAQMEHTRMVLMVFPLGKSRKIN